MKCNIEIAMDNDAFIGDVPFDGTAQLELSRILRKLADAVSVGELESLVAMDINGNKVGALSISEEGN